VGFGASLEFNMAMSRRNLFSLEHNKTLKRGQAIHGHLVSRFKRKTNKRDRQQLAKELRHIVSDL
jgi:hypothetical protein